MSGASSDDTHDTPGASLRFVVLRHNAPEGAHYDLMLEWERGDASEDRALRTWRTEDDAFPRGDGERLVPLERHRRHYLHHEGDIGDGRGSVVCADAGAWRSLSLADERIEIELQGVRLRGRYRLVRTGGPGSFWRFEALGA